jgi:hypothetical protein
MARGSAGCSLQSAGALIFGVGLMKLSVALAFALLAAPLPAFAAQSIVGSWDFPENKCSSPIIISAMAMKSEDVDCKFSTVTRSGNTVTWKGICDGAEGASNETVIAKLNAKGRLNIRYVPGGNVLPGLRRCK